MLITCISLGNLRLSDRFYVHTIQLVGSVESYPRLYWYNSYNKNPCIASTCIMVLKTHNHAGIKPHINTSVRDTSLFCMHGE